MSGKKIKVISALLAVVLLVGCGSGKESIKKSTSINNDKLVESINEEEEKNSQEDSSENESVEEGQKSESKGEESEKSEEIANKDENIIDEEENSDEDNGDETFQKKRIRNLKPINRIVIGKDFLLKGVKGIEGIDVNDPGIKAQWAVGYTNSYIIWDKIDQKRQIRVAVIDTGVDYNHPDLKSRVNKKLGYDFINNDSDPMDDNGHGTHVSGIIGAEMNNNQGIVGIVGDLDIEIIPIKALDEEGAGTVKTVYDSIIYAVDNEADIINLSLGGVGKNSTIEEAIDYALDRGVLVVAASGNERTDCDNYIPAGAKGVYTVAATSPLNRTARFSNYGASVDIAAPGVKILSSVPGGGYEAWDGTSMATPVVTGIAAMLLAENPQMDMDKLKGILDSSAKDIMSEGKDENAGWGLIDAEKAYKMIEK